MSLQLFYHPLSSYSMKALIALYENGTPFEYRMLSPDHADNYAKFAGMWPIQKFPILLDGERMVVEASIVIEHLSLYYPGPVRLLPADPKAALEVRMMDRFFDNHIATPQQKLVADVLRPADQRDPLGVAEAKGKLETAYVWLDKVMANRTWAAGEEFSMADCAAAPFLLYAHWSHPIPAKHEHVMAYLARLRARPSFARCWAEAKPYRHMFPLGVPAGEE
ncbi:glutathione S-transferase family protein [Pseudoduganella eburnea]|uniref:Glutathione S-transferase family protein n=1 Tax=Massilia eburnea TaxID=1776165 RepID=A0A6L6QFA9_9BURK|nr:glutathione S-transferase family protein [Massilia eburnea]MTW10567.1 glutathione S-transferase family protein [Massilia eburnea]